METRVIELCEGVTATISRKTVKQYVFQRSYDERFKEHFAQYGETVAAYWTHFTLCSSQTVAIEGVDWQPPSLYADVETVQASFMAWLDTFDPDAILEWFKGITEINAPLTAPELTPTWEAKDGNDPK